VAYTPQVLTSVRMFAGGYDLTGYSNKAEFSTEVEEKDATTFLPSSDANCGWKKVIGGLGSGSIKASGLWDADPTIVIDDIAYPALGTIVPFSIYPVDTAEGSLGYFTQTLEKNYTFLGAVGDVAPWSLEEDSTWPVVRGQSLEAAGTARTTTGTGTAVQIGAVPAGKQLYAALHVLSIAGTGTPTLTVVVQSDNAVGFPSPATSLTFAAATTVGGQILRVAGPITDDWARVSFTISGSTPSFLFVVTAGISV
jgi:hypothetical protein